MQVTGAWQGKETLCDVSYYLEILQGSSHCRVLDDDSEGTETGMSMNLQIPG